jgi:hypothetical protein
LSLNFVKQSKIAVPAKKLAISRPAVLLEGVPLFPIRVLAGACALLAVPLLGDLAPVQYASYGISPIKANGVRMLSAKVDITGGTPCTLSATFVMDNQTAKPADIQLGFPIQKVWRQTGRQTSQVTDEMTFAFDGVPVSPASIAINDPVTEKLKLIKIKNADIQHLDDVELVQYFNDESRKLDPEHKGIHFVLRPPAAKSQVAHRTNIRYGLGEDRLIDVLRSTEFKYSIEDGTVYLEPSSYGDDIQDPDQYTWYRCRHTFAPGQTKVTVTTKFPASFTYSYEYRECLHYCIETGGAWDGTIGSEEVAIHFPNAIPPDRIYAAHPKDYTTHGGTVRWLFKDFKPQGKDHDIDIEYLRPDVIAAIAQARTELARDPADPGRVIKLAKELFALGPYKGYAPYAPDKLTPKELNDLAAKAHGTDQALFKSFYALNGKGEYELSDDQWQKNDLEILRVLNAINYQPPDDQSPDVNEARDLMDRLLLAHPDNAEAWKVYLANRYRFHFVGRGDVYYPDEVALITKAANLCPNDDCLQLWFKLISKHDAGNTERVYGRWSNPLGDRLKKEGILDNELPKISFDYE